MIVKASDFTFHADNKNGTQMESWPKKRYYLDSVTGICIPVCFWAIIGNGIVLLFLGCRIETNKYKTYVLNLAISDLIVLFYYLTVFILSLTSLHINLYFSRVMETIYLFGHDTNVYLLTAFSAERSLAVFSPIWYQGHQTKHLSAIVCASLWALSCLISPVKYFTCYPSFLSSHNDGIFKCNAANIFYLILNLLIFIPIMVCSSVALLIRMQRRPQGTSPVRIDISIVTMVVLFLIFGASFIFVDFVIYLEPKLDVPVLFLVFLLFDSINSSLKPFVYLFAGCWKRQRPQESLSLFLERALKE